MHTHTMQVEALDAEAAVRALSALQAAGLKAFPIAAKHLRDCAVCVDDLLVVFKARCVCKPASEIHLDVSHFERCLPDAHAAGLTKVLADHISCGNAPPNALARFAWRTGGYQVPRTSGFVPAILTTGVGGDRQDVPVMAMGFSWQ